MPRVFVRSDQPFRAAEGDFWLNNADLSDTRLYVCAQGGRDSVWALISTVSPESALDPDTAGAIWGDVGSVDGGVPRADGTAGDTVQESNVIIDDSDNVTGVAALTVTGNLTTPSIVGEGSAVSILVDSSNRRVFGHTAFISSGSLGNIETEIVGASVAASSLSLIGYTGTTTTNAPSIVGLRSRGTSIGTMTQTQTGDTLFEIVAAYTQSIGTFLAVSKISFIQGRGIKLEPTIGFGTGNVDIAGDLRILEDTGTTHYLAITAAEALSTDRTLSIVTGDSDRTLTLAGDATISGTNTGDVTLAGTPDYITISGQVITRNAVDLAADVTGDLPYSNLTQAGGASRLLGRGSASGAGDWEDVTLGTGLSMSGTVLSSNGGITPAALTKGDDTNVTLTLGGTPGTALLQAASITAGWTGTLAATRGGTGTGSYAVGDILYADSTTTLAKLGVGSDSEVLTLVSGVPSWEPATGGIPTQITVANEASDTSCFVAFFTAATGDLGPKTNANLTFNSNTGVLTSASSVLTTTDINGGTIDGVTIGGASAGAGTFTNITGTGVIDFGTATSLTIPRGGAPTVNADGEIAIDTAVIDFDEGVIKYFSTAEMGVVAMPVAQFTSPTGGYVVTYSGTDNNFELAPTGIPSTVQGDILFASFTNTLTTLAKNASATRYLSNTGGSNNPAWSQVDLTNGVTGDLPFANLTQGSARSVLGVTGNATADVASIQGAANEVLRVNSGGTALAFGQVNLASSAAVTGTLPVANGGTGFADRACFQAYNSADDNNVTGGGTEYTCDFNTEVIDVGGDFSADTFTAPVTGAYELIAKVRVSGITAAADQIQLKIVTSNRTYTMSIIDTNDLPSTSDLSFSMIADMDASDTATVTITVSGEASNVCDVIGGTAGQTVFSGWGPIA